MFAVCGLPPSLSARDVFARGVGEGRGKGGHGGRREGAGARTGREVDIMSHESHVIQSHSGHVLM